MCPNFQVHSNWALHENAVAENQMIGFALGNENKKDFFKALFNILKYE